MPCRADGRPPAPGSTICCWATSSPPAPITTQRPSSPTSNTGATPSLPTCSWPATAATSRCSPYAATPAWWCAGRRDVDQDGSADLVSTLDVLSRKHDVLELRTLLSSGTVKRRFKLPVPTGIDAVAICPPDGPGRAPIVLASKSQLWVLR